MAEEKKVEINALQAFCHAHVDEHGRIDPQQPYMGVVSVSVMRGKDLDKVNILANTIVSLRVVQPGIQYPVSVLTLRNGSLKYFKNSGKSIYKAFNVNGVSFDYEDHFGKGFYEYINESMVRKWLEKAPKKGAYTVTFTIDQYGAPHKLEYPRFEQELSENAARLTDIEEASSTHSHEISSAGEELLQDSAEG